MPLCTLIGVMIQFIVYTFVRLVFYILCKITFQLPLEWVCAPGHWMLCEVMWPLWLSRANPSNLCVIWLHKSPSCDAELGWAGRRYDAGNNWLWGDRTVLGDTAVTHSTWYLRWYWTVVPHCQLYLKIFHFTTMKWSGVWCRLQYSQTGPSECFNVFQRPN